MRNAHPGLDLMEMEMARQRADALQTITAAGKPAQWIASQIRATGRLVLYGIGGSHHVNRIAETLYLDAGIDTRAVTASDALLSPLPDAPRVGLITSQSGRSGEIVELLARPPGLEQRFGLTLDNDGPLAMQTTGSLIAAGGPERAFAASRSIILSIAMHAAILEALGIRQTAAKDLLAASKPVDATQISYELKDADVIVFVGRHVMRGVAESASLSMLELARVPTIALEGGQFRHGAFEFLRPGLAIVLLRSAGPDASGIEELARTAVSAGCRTVILDSSGLEPVHAGLTHALEPAAGLAAALAALLFLQDINIAVALHRIEAGVGTPLRTSKVTL